jgi:hypothetical protein
MLDHRFLADGHKRTWLGLEPQLEALRIKIKLDIDAEFAPQLSAAGIMRRWILHLRMKRELRRRLAQVVAEFEAKAPPDALY